MKRIQFTLIVLLLATIGLKAQEQDKEAIKKVIQTAYVEGLQNEGDTVKVNSGIHPEFRLLGIGKNDNEMRKLPIDEWKDRVIKRKQKGEYPRKGDKLVSVKFLNIDVTGSAAVAKIEFYVGKELKYVDYIGLYKFSKGWKMVSKIYQKM